MEQPLEVRVEDSKRKKHQRLDDEAWKQVSTFVEAYFQKQEKAANTTYKILFTAISAQFPGVVLERTAFQKHVGSIEVLKSRAGIFIPTEHLSKDRRSLVKDEFLRVLNGLTLPEFKSIRVGELVERAHRSNPDLRINEINKNTLASHFPFKALKALAQEQRPAETPVPLGHSAQAVEAPCPRSLESAAGIDGQPLLNRRGQPDDEDTRDPDARIRAPKLQCQAAGNDWDPFDTEFSPPSHEAARSGLAGEGDKDFDILERVAPRAIENSEAEDLGHGLSPQSVDPARPEAGCSALGHASVHGLAMICGYSSKEASESSSAQKPVNGRSEPGAEHCMCILFACLVLVLKHLVFAIFGRSRRSCC